MNCPVCGTHVQRLADGKPYEGETTGMGAHFKVCHPGRTVGGPDRPGDWVLRPNVT